MCLDLCLCVLSVCSVCRLVLLHMLTAGPIGIYYLMLHLSGGDSTVYSLSSVCTSVSLSSVML